MFRLVCVLAAGLLPTAFVNAADGPTVLKGARLLSVAGSPIEGGVLVIENGKIAAIGDANTAIPHSAPT